MKTVSLFCLLMALSITTCLAVLAFGTAQGGTLTAPTAFQIDPYLIGNCWHDKPATTAYATSTEGGILTGVASIQGYVCQLKVHAGRGPGIRIFSACADVTWDMYGNILSVTPTASDTSYSIVCE